MAQIWGRGLSHLGAVLLPDKSMGRGSCQPLPAHPSPYTASAQDGSCDTDLPNLPLREKASPSFSHKPPPGTTATTITILPCRPGSRVLTDLNQAAPAYLTTPTSSEPPQAVCHSTLQPALAPHPLLGLLSFPTLAPHQSCQGRHPLIPKACIILSRIPRYPAGLVPLPVITQILSYLPCVPINKPRVSG